MKKTINIARGIFLGTAMAAATAMPVFAAAAVGNTPISVEIKQDKPEIPRYNVTVPTSLALVVYADSDAAKANDAPVVLVGGIGVENGSHGLANLIFENSSTLTKDNNGVSQTEGMALKISDTLIKATGNDWKVVTGVATTDPSKQIAMELNGKKGVKYGNDLEFTDNIILAAPVVKDPATGEVHTQSKTDVQYAAAVSGKNSQYTTAETPAAAFTVEWTIDR